MNSLCFDKKQNTFYHAVNNGLTYRAIPSLIFAVFLFISISCGSPTRGVNTPELKISPLSLGFGSLYTGKTVSIHNDGGGTLLWEISVPDDAGWCSVDKQKGNDDTIITILVNRLGLKGGFYETLVSITSNGGSASIHVTMTVDETGEIIIHVSLPDKE
jgi:hypothetical protein